MTTQSGAIVITGVAGGMGVAVARELAGNGDLVLVDQRAAELDAAKKRLGTSQVSARSVVCDVTAQGDVARLAWL